MDHLPTKFAISSRLNNIQLAILVNGRSLIGSAKDTGHSLASDFLTLSKTTKADESKKTTRQRGDRMS